MNVAQEVIEDSERRQPDLDILIGKAKDGSLLTLETSGQIGRRADILNDAGPEPFRPALERLLGNNDLLPFNYLEGGMTAGNAVARLLVNDAANNNYGRATGFLISPKLILTNNHVIPDASFASNSIAEFNFEFTISGETAAGTSFRLDPERFFYTSKTLDFTVISIFETDTAGKKNIAEFGFIPLDPRKGKVTLGEFVSIIQHPGGQEKQIAIRENQLIDHDATEDFIWYRTDTTPGSSGSPVFNDQWKLVALHHSGVPEKDINGHYLTTDGKPIDPVTADMIDTSNIKWKANEGVRVSSIMRVLSTECIAEPLIGELVNGHLTPAAFTRANSEVNGKTTPLSETFLSTNKNQIMASANTPGTFHFTLPLNITVSLGEPLLPAALPVVQPLKSVTPDNTLSEDFSEGVIVINQHYGDRKGFDENFLGEKIGLPELNPAQKSKAAKLIGSENYVLKYYHFSIVINKDRKMPFFTAVNIDGEKYNKVKSQIPSRKNIGTDKWYIDPRIEPDPSNPQFQLPAKFYAGNDFDIGHQVRREDPVWGDTAAQAIKCNNDTFHLTNACPQHKSFNQGINDRNDPRYKNAKGKILWQGLENYILDNARKNNLRVNLYTGPVLAKNDKAFKGTDILIPITFWKVVVMAKQNGELNATAYIVSQEELVEGMLEEFQFGKFLFYNVPVSHIEKLTGLAFDLSKFESPKNKNIPAGEILEMEEIKAGFKPIEDFREIERILS